jgi:hypothetical protein
VQLLALTLTLARFVIAAAGLVAAAFAVLVGLVTTLVGSVDRLSALAARRSTAIRLTFGAGRGGGWGLAARRVGGQYCALTPSHGNRPGGFGVLYDQGQSDAEDRPKQRPHDDQELAEPAKRSIHRASNIE